MRTKYLFLGAIFSFLGLVSQAQVYEMYSQGYETNDPVNYTITNNGSEFATNLYVGGQRSLRLKQNTTNDVVMLLDTLDFTQNSTLRYVTLEFDHINNIATNLGSTLMGLIYVKRANQSDDQYTQLTGQHYRTEEGSDQFPPTASFNNFSYDEWHMEPLSNALWKHERFDIDDILSAQVPVNERKLIFKFVLKKRTLSGSVPSDAGWWIDNMKIRASRDEMIKPIVNMTLYPDGYNHPSSRGARIELDAFTTVQQGINNDSVYILYTVGSDLTPIRLPMQYDGNITRHDNYTYSHYSARIPFEGYDTLMRFYCVVKDASTNANEITFPATADTWVSYRCVRGVEQLGNPAPVGLTGPPNSNYGYCPFPPYIDNRSEWVYDSALLANAGYGPGAMTEIKFTIGANTQSSTRTNFQLRMKNAPASYTVPSNGDPVKFTKDYMDVVFDSTFSIGEAAAGAILPLRFQDTFFYAGKDIVFQVFYDGSGTVDPAQATIKMIPALSSKQTIFFNGLDAFLGGSNNAYTNSDFKTAGDQISNRPSVVPTQRRNQPLVHDMGVASLVFPNSTNPVVTQPTHLDVELKNFGVSTANAIRISYAVDDTVTGHFDWTGTLAGGASTTVTIATGLTMAAGFHTFRAWVEDTMTVGNNHYRDHEPLNDTSFSEFIACAGALTGVRYIGGPNADYGNIREFLFSLSRCGLSDSLIVKLAPGAYEPFEMPVVNGLAGGNYLVFEPASNGVTMYSASDTAAIVNLVNAQNVRFRDIKFVRRSGRLTNMVTLGPTSHNCRFERCEFVDSLANPASSHMIASMVHSGFANNLTVDGCTFRGGNIGVSLVGQSADARAQNGTITRSLFENQYNNAVNVTHMAGVTIERNEMYDVADNASYVLLVYSCSGTLRVMANKLYTSHGAGALGVSNIYGTTANHAFIANNMIVCNDDGQSNLLTTPMNIIQGEWMDVVYNSVKMTASQRNNVATATVGNSVINSRFMNNIVACFDESNYALNYVPFSMANNDVGHNVYYSEAYTLNRIGGTNFHALDQWAAATGDNTSAFLDPAFLNGSRVDLRTYNRLIKGLGTPISGITTDMFDTVRHAQTPCPGAFEFVSLYYDFEPEAMTSPVADTCDMPASVELVVRLRNSGVNVFTPNATRTLSLSYRVNNGAVHTFQVTQTIPADDTITIHSGQMLQLPANGIYDSTYHIKVWTACSNDPNQTNDTNIFTVISRYHQPAASDMTLTIPYATAATVVPTAGVQQWDAYASATAPKRRSKLYWYRSMNDAAPFYVGDTLVTASLRQDTHFYFKQRRSAPIVRITQVQFKPNNAVGLTDPMPQWMKSTTKFAVQLTNVGDDTAYLQGDTLIMVSPTSTYNNKVLTFWDVRIAPGKSIVVQYVDGTSTNPAVTIHYGVVVSPAANANIGIIYRHNGVVEDAVALNAVITTSTTTSPRWATQGVPSHVWSGAALTVTPNTTGGIVRTAFNGRANDWRMATAADPMFIGDVDGSWIRYSDNGCPTEFATATVLMQSVPTADIGVEAGDLPTGCGLGNETVTAKLHNYGTQTATGMVMHYQADGGAVVTENMSGTVVPGAERTFTFSQPLNMAVSQNQTINVKIWVSGVSGDTYHVNDTDYVSSLSLYQPGLPTVASPRSVAYGMTETITANPGAGAIAVWYDSLNNVLDTGDVYVTDPLYAPEVIGLRYVVADTIGGHIGTLADITAKNAYPSPYQPNNKFVKQQFIYSAHELRKMGLKTGDVLTSLSFHLDSIWVNVQAVSFSNYYISLGHTTDTIYSSTTAWKTTQLVYTRSPFVLRSNSMHQWVAHEFDTPFTWDGVSSIAVQVAYELTDAVTTGVQTAFTAKTNTTLHKNNNSALSPSVIGFTAAGTRGNNRPDIVFNHPDHVIDTVVFGCEGPIKPITINVTGVPTYDARISWPDGYDAATYNSCGNVEMDVVLRNYGGNVITGAQLRYSIDGGALQTTNVTGSIAVGATSRVQLMSQPIAPGRHSIKAIVVVAGDVVHDNDTIEMPFMVRFCGGTYNISSAATADFHTISAAVDTLNVVGIDGPVVFKVASGVYNEQIVLNEIIGSSATNTVTFRGVSDTTVLMTASTSQNLNYVIKLEGASNVIIDSMRIEARPTANNVNYANAVVMQDAQNIVLQNSTIRVKGTINNANASCVVLQGNVKQLQVLNSWIDSGYFSFKNTGTVENYKDFVFRNNRITNFWNRGIELQGVTNINITQNEIRSGVTIAGRGLVGISLTNVDSAFMISKNKIYLIDDKTGGKQGIYLSSVKCSNQQYGYIVNNMISCYGSAAAGLTNPGGIIMTDCEYVNVYFNSVRVYSGTAVASRAMLLTKTNNTGSSHHIQVINNILANYSSFAYYVTDGNILSTSDYNAFYAGATNFAYWGANCATIDVLRATSNRDISSRSEEAYFAAIDDLHLLVTNFAGKAQYNPDVTDDIDGTERTSIPAPTIGAHQMTILSRNMSIVRILSPKMPANRNNPLNIETDSVLVKVIIYNNGSATETNAYWYAYVKDHETGNRSANRPLGTVLSGQSVTDSVWMPTQLGLIDTQMVRVVLVSENDSDTTDNVSDTAFYLAPAYDLEAQKIQVSQTGCDLHNVTVSITLKNVGFKDMPANMPYEIGFHTQAYYPSYQQNNPMNNRLAIATMPDTVRETHTFATVLPKGQPRTVTFDSIVNLYPTDTVLNIKVRLNGWCHYQYDITATNDSTGAAASASPVIDSWYTPAAPVGRDTTFAYGTWGEVTASQVNQRPISWYRDSTASPFYSVSGTNLAAYNASRRWSTTPRFFHDSTYYLRCSSDKNCASHFSEVHVSVAPQVPVDVALETAITPLGGRVYMENDTVRVRIVNYGTQAVSDIPITFQVRKGNNTNPIQQVTEICHTTLQPGQTYVYTFDSLFQYSTPLAAGNFFLRAWTNLDNDMVRRNDTLRWVNQLRPTAPNNTLIDYPFNALAESTYPTRTNSPNGAMDITRVSFNEIDVDLPAMGRSYTNFGVYTNPEWPVLHLTRGTTDSILVGISLPGSSERERGKVAVYIDFNRDGSFLNVGEDVVTSTVLFTDEVLRRTITVPRTASLGYMKMRVVVSNYDKEPTPSMESSDGHMVDFLVFVDPQAPDTDLAITQIVSPRSSLIRDDNPVTVSFRMANKGTTTITSADLIYLRQGGGYGSTRVDTLHWTGVLPAGNSAVVTLPDEVFNYGTTYYAVWHTLPNDGNTSNDTLLYEYHHFHTITLILDDNFDSLNYWYAPTGYNLYTRNYWQCGIPTKNRIAAAYSEPNVWVTDLHSNNIITGRRGNVSYLYSPVIDISQIRSDTLSFRMQRNLTNGSYAHVEFYNYRNEWEKLVDTVGNRWYNNVDDLRFDNTSNGYTEYKMSTDVISGDFNEKLQFRFVYTTPQTSNDGAGFAEGCAIDDFRIGRARRRIDVGVVDVITPSAPRYGETYYPEVVVKNFGLDTITSVNMGYTYYGTYLAPMATFSCNIPPDGYDTLQFSTPFIVTSDFPDTFTFVAFTKLSADIYTNNDTLKRDFALSPLDEDLAAVEFVYPLNRVIAGDSVEVTMRVRNFGYNEIPSATFTYIINGGQRCVEQVNFEDILNHPLRTREYCNYTFRQKFRAAMGNMQITGYVESDVNDYVYNDTIQKRFMGIASITDVAAAAVVVDTSNYNWVKVQLVIENRGARSVNAFEVGFWYDNDTSTIVRDTFYRPETLQALASTTHLFDVQLPTRSAPYDHFVGFVHAEGDNDPSNDTTTQIDRQFVDIEVLGLIVEENAEPDCRVFIQLRNIGNLALTGKTIPLRATINGNELSDNIVRRLDPGRIATVEFSRTIPKSPVRSYVGNGRIQNLAADVNPANNQTTHVAVVNYVEGMPTVTAGVLDLGQNYPNPYAHRTTVPFSVPDAARVRFFVMDAMGKMVNSFELYAAPGDNTVELDMDNYPSGVYYYGIEVNGERRMRKMILR